jgi:hypothetical protein
MSGVLPARLVDAQLVEQGAEFVPVLGHIDGLGAGAQDAHAGAVQADSQVIGQLPSHRNHHTIRLLALVDLQH